jgi:hypothetical protein
MLRLLEDANIGKFVWNQLTNIAQSKDGIVKFVIPRWIESGK